MVAQGSPDHSEAVHVHADVEFQDLSNTILRHIEVAVLDESIDGGKERVLHNKVAIESSHASVWRVSEYLR